jgi:lipopolysaccharide heptosyltransferase I
LSSVGDVVRTLPSLASLRKNFPSARIAWIVEEKSSDILLGQPELDEVIVFPRKAWSQYLLTGRWWSLTREVAAFIRKLRQERFDLAIDFHGILKSGLLSALTGAGVRVGFGRGFCKEMNHLFSNWRVTLPHNTMSRFERNRRLLEGMGFETNDTIFRLSIPSEDREYIEDFFRQHDLMSRYPIVALQPGTSDKMVYKRWFPESYACVADRLVKETGATIILTWGPGERETAERVQSLMKASSVVSCPASLKQLAGIYQHCHLYIGGDTGPMHIASLMGIPVVVIYGPTDPVVNAPYDGTPSIQVRSELPCSPCRDRDCQRLDCLRAIKPDDVLRGAKDLLSSAKKASGDISPQT